MYFDYLNEFLLFAGRKNRRSGTYQRALALKRRGDAHIFNQLCQEYTGRFKWKYKPTNGAPSICEELIERTILENGMCALFKMHEEHGSYSRDEWRNARAAAVGDPSFYGYPNTVELTDYSGNSLGNYIPVQDQDDSDIANCVLIYDNSSRWSPIITVLYYAERLSKLNASISGCIENILGTSIITCDESQMRDIARQREAAAAGTPYILKIDGYGGQQDPNLMYTPGASEALKTLYEAFDKTHADYLQSIGIRSNNEIDKKSGVTPIEIVENRQNVDLILNQALEMRLNSIYQAERIGIEPGSLTCELSNFESKTANYDANGRKIETDTYTDDNGGEAHEEEMV